MSLRSIVTDAAVKAPALYFEPIVKLWRVPSDVIRIMQRRRVARQYIVEYVRLIDAVVTLEEINELFEHYLEVSEVLARHSVMITLPPMLAERLDAIAYELSLRPTDQPYNYKIWEEIRTAYSLGCIRGHLSAAVTSEPSPNSSLHVSEMHSILMRTVDVCRRLELEVQHWRAYKAEPLTLKPPVQVDEKAAG